MGAGKNWSPDEDRILKQMYPTLATTELKKLLPNRPNIQSIFARANKLGVKKITKHYETRYYHTETVIGHLTETEKAYLAGLVDGEGSFSLRKYKLKNGKSNYSIRVQISNTDKRLADWIKERLPGHMYSYKPKPSHTGNNRRTLWTWAMNGDVKPRIFLREIYPYLIIKKDQAELLRDGYRHLSDKEKDIIVEKLKQMKKIEFL